MVGYQGEEQMTIYPLFISVKYWSHAQFALLRLKHVRNATSRGFEKNISLNAQTVEAISYEIGKGDIARFLIALITNLANFFRRACTLYERNPDFFRHEGFLTMATTEWLSEEKR